MRYESVSPKTYGIVNNITATYQGNQIASLRDDAANVLLESSLDMPHGQWSGSDFEYDRNGNQTRDLSRGVADIVYNELNLPERIEMNGGGSIEYLYSATGTKLAEIASGHGIFSETRRDYVGVFEYEQGDIKRIALSSGYVTVADTTLHIYIPDYQGNIVAVYNTATGRQERYHDYYPYGMPHVAISSSSTTTPTFPGLSGGSTSGSGSIIISPGTPPSISLTETTDDRRRFSAKELTTDHGLNSYDFEARHLALAFPRFTSPDPLAVDYHPVSPYTYCNGDPINNIDPTGQFIETIWDIGNVIYDVGAAAYNHITGDHETAKEHWVDAGADLAAAVVPFVPAGTTKAARATYKAAQTVSKMDNHIKPNSIPKAATIPASQPQKAQNQAIDSQTQDKDKIKHNHAEHKKIRAPKIGINIRPIELVRDTEKEKMNNVEKKIKSISQNQTQTKERTLMETQNEKKADEYYVPEEIFPQLNSVYKELSKNEDWEGIIKFFQPLGEKYCREYFIFTELSICHYNLQNPKLALFYAKKAMEVEKHDVIVLDAYACALKLNKLYDEAISVYNQIIHKRIYDMAYGYYGEGWKWAQSYHINAFFWKAECYYFKGDYKKARRLLKLHISKRRRGVFCIIKKNEALKFLKEIEKKLHLNKNRRPKN